MKPTKLTALATTLATTLPAICIPALAVPRYWEADVRSPAAFQTAAYRGETVQLTARLADRGAPFEVPAGATARMLVSTNDFRDGCWEWPATVSTNGLVRATWTPDMDPGGPAVRIFLAVSESGTNVNYGANCTMRLLGSPGATPNALPLPAGTIGAARLPAATASSLGAARPDNDTITVASGVLSAPYLTNRLYRADEIDAIAMRLALRDSLLADLRGYAASDSLDVRYGIDAAEGPTFWSGGAERNLCFAWWQRWDAPVPDQAMPVMWLLSSAFSTAPARSTSEGGPELPDFLRVEDVPLDANGYWATNCVPQDSLDTYGGTSGDFVVCANVTTDVAITLSVGGVAREFAPSNAMQVLNFQVPRGNATVSVQASDAGGAVSLALAVNPWIEFKGGGTWGPENGSMSLSTPGGTNTWTMFAWRLDYDGAGTVRSRISALTDSGDWKERTNTVSGLSWGARMPENIRFRTVFSSMYGGLEGHEVWRYGLTRVLSGEVDDAALVRMWRRGRDELKALGLWTALPFNGGYAEQLPAPGGED